MFIWLIVIPVITGAQHKYEDVTPDSVQLWLDQRIKMTEKREPEIVRIPFVVRSQGWGCLCPMHYMGTSTVTQDGPWISPVLPKDFPAVNEKGQTFIVTGYFNGQWATEDYRDKNGEPDGYLYRMPVLVITTWETAETDTMPAPAVTGKARPAGSKKKKKAR